MRLSVGLRLSLVSSQRAKPGQKSEHCITFTNYILGPAIEQLTGEWPIFNPTTNLKPMYACRKVKNSQARTGHQRGMGGRETDDPRYRTPNQLEPEPNNHRVPAPIQTGEGVC